MDKQKKKTIVIIDDRARVRLYSEWCLSRWGRWARLGHGLASLGYPRHAAFAQSIIHNGSEGGAGDPDSDIAEHVDSVIVALLAEYKHIAVSIYVFKMTERDLAEKNSVSRGYIRDVVAHIQGAVYSECIKKYHDRLDMG